MGNDHQYIWIARHGNRLDFVDPEWFNTAKRRYDPPLSPDGFCQVEMLAERLKNETIKHIFVSPFLRTIQTAYPIAQVLNLPLKIERGLSEWLNPEWMLEMAETVSEPELKQEFPLIDWHYQSLVIPEYPENTLQLQERMAKTISLLIKNYGENMLLISHSDPIKCLVLSLLRENKEINTPVSGLIKLEKIHNQWQLKLNGDLSHLIPNPL